MLRPQVAKRNGGKQVGQGKTGSLALLRVRPLPGDATRGTLLAGGAVIPCALGRSGITSRKREGDGASPRGVFRLRGGFYRPDRFPVRPISALPLRATRRDDGWCDAPQDRRYNRPIRFPSDTASAERLWRDDGLYDLVIDLDYNRGPIRPGRVVGDLPARRPQRLSADGGLRRPETL